jgi:DNA sulfur modification protein DndD
MKIRVIGWESVGLRCPDIAVAFGDSTDVRSVVLIQMPNGTGKTTTLTLIRAAMTGSAERWDRDYVTSLRRARAENTDGRFVLRLLVDKLELTFEMTFDFVEGAVIYHSSHPGLGGKTPGWHCPPNTRRFLKERFTDLFVFDGELANRLLEREHTEAERAIDALCQVDLLDRVVQVAHADWAQALQGQQGAKTRQGLGQWQKKEEVLLAHEKKTIANQNALAARRSKLDARIAELQKRINDRALQNKKFTAEVTAARERKTTAEMTLATVLTDTFDNIRKPQQLSPGFASALDAFRSSLDKARLPETSSKQFFLELADDAECVCGRPIGEKERFQIREHASRYLGDEIAGVINAIKSDITQYNVAREGGATDVMTSSLQTLADAENELLSAATALEAVVTSSLAEGDQVELLADQDELTKATLELASVTDYLADIERAARPDESETSPCLAAIRKHLKDIRNKIAEISDTVVLREQLDKIEALAKRTKDIARDRIREALRIESNNRLQSVLAADPIQLSRIGQSLELDSQRGASVGQTLAVGYTFLASVLHRGAHQFPLIVDSPAGPLDHSVRKEIALMIPELAEQFIAFVISTEREGFVPWLEKKGGPKVQYLTIFRKTPATQSLLGALPKRGVFESDNAVLVNGKEYFNNFALIEEQ